jgi:hypothetical protein
VKNVKLIDLPSGIIYLASVMLLYIIPYIFGDKVFVFFENYIEWFMSLFKYLSVISESSPYKNDYKLFFSFILYGIPFCSYLYFIKPIELKYDKIVNNKFKFFIVMSIFWPLFLVGIGLTYMSIDHIPTTIVMHKITMLMVESKLMLIVLFSSVVVFYSFGITMLVAWFANIRKYYF